MPGCQVPLWGGLHVRQQSSWRGSLACLAHTMHCYSPPPPTVPPPLPRRRLQQPQLSPPATRPQNRWGAAQLSSCHCGYFAVRVWQQMRRCLPVRAPAREHGSVCPRSRLQSALPHACSLATCTCWIPPPPVGPLAPVCSHFASSLPTTQAPVAPSSPSASDPPPDELREVGAGAMAAVRVGAALGRELQHQHVAWHAPVTHKPCLLALQHRQPPPTA